MPDYSYLYIIRHKNPDIKGCYIVKMRENKPKYLSFYKYAHKKLKGFIGEQDASDFEMIFFKKIHYGSGYEARMIKQFYIKQLGAIN